MTITRKNLQSVLEKAGRHGISRKDLQILFHAFEAKKINRLNETIEAERKSGFLEILPGDYYKKVGATNEPDHGQINKPLIAIEV